MKILYEDKYLIVVKKDAGIATQTAQTGQKDLVSELKNHIHDANPTQKEPYLGVIHRLDQPVEGILVFAKTPEAAKALSKQLQEGEMKKEYMAVVCNSVEPGIHTLVDYLKKDERTNTSSVVRVNEKNAKRAELTYQEYENRNPSMDFIRNRLEIRAELHLVKIRLFTGRHHQIRVQMANAGMPLLGDRKYGKPVEGYDGGINLCAYHLVFRHPNTRKEMEFRIIPANLQIL